MAERIWTHAQLSAIEYRGRNLLVSAAAGSGKTATLTERIIRLITDPEINADISRMLVVTFTKAAAAELRERVAAALGEASSADPENKHLTDQLCKISGASISTMDSFFLSCVKPMFDQVGLPADFRIGDKAELDALRAEAMEETVEYLFDSDEDGRRFSAVVEAIGSARTEDGLDAILLDFCAEADRVGIGEAELCRYADELCRYKDTDILATPFGQCILDELSAGLRHFGRIASYLAPIMADDEYLKKSYAPAAFNMAEYCERCISAIDDGDLARLRIALEAFPSDRIMTKNPTAESNIFKEVRSEFKAFAKNICEGYLSDDPAIAADVMVKTAEVCRGAGEMIGEFVRRFSELKRRRGITDHSDITRMAAMLLSDSEGNPTPYGETVAAKYDYVFIDEYQDTSIYQDKIFAAVASKCGRFMVGDIKQSIYRFRGGEPTVFTGYREAWSDGTEGNTVFMSENFRCVEPVTEFVNAVSKYMFPFGHIPFEEGDLLIHGRREVEGYEPLPVEVCLIERPGKQRGDDSDDGDKAEAESKTDAEDEIVPHAAVIEAEYVAKRIRHMLDHEFLPDGNPVRASDIAVMLRETKSRMQIITEVFAKYGIPLKDTEDEPLLVQPEIMLLICILRAVDNPTRDIYLAGAMRSAVFGFSVGDIAEIRTVFDDAGGRGSLWDAVRYLANAESDKNSTIAEKCRNFCEQMREYRALSRTLSAAPLIYRLIHEPSVNYAMEIEGGVGAMDRVMQFYDIARGRDTGLYDFLGYLSYIEKTGVETPPSGGGEGVSVMTVHHSKGLEFPVCFLMNATKKYNRNDGKKSMLLDRNFGVALKLPDEMGLVRCDNHLRRLAVFRSLRENSYEEMRVLYVAMTRARERLIVTGVTNSPEKLLGAADMNSKFYDEYTVASKDNYMDIILESMNLYGGRFATVTAVPYVKAEDNSEVTEEEYPIWTDGPESADTSELEGMLKGRIDFEYEYRHLQNIPSKLTVSKLYPEILDEFDEGAVSLESEEPTAPSVPKFMSGTAYSPADAGSAAHVLLQFCDFERLRDLGVGAELCRLVAEGFMSKAEGEAANLVYVEAFRKSKLFERILSAKEIRREFRFNAALPAASFTADEEKRALLEADGVDVIAQGVIDIVFTDAEGKLILADYKTDRLTPYELQHKSAAAEKLWNRHGNQLRYYALVCEKLFGKAPDEVLIYSMPLGDTV
ncbi:MAG: UvrD-helicase domain-containing protein [Clostridia bacterium]|nr:UvrD-helicase domain-containing protein [Clostridia bacterium]